MSEKEIIAGGQKAQRELKGYSKTTEVWIPLLQTLSVMVAVDVLAGLLVYLVVAAGPVALRVVMGVAMLIGFPILAFGRGPGQMPENWEAWRENKDRRVAAGLLLGAVAITASQAGMTRLEPFWPWGWLYSTDGLSQTGCLCSLPC